MLTEQDETARRGRVTASTVAAFLGFHWYQSPSQAWELHTGLREFEMNDSVRLGQYLEPGLVEAVTARLGWHDYIYPCQTIISQDYLWAAATPDVMLGTTILEQNINVVDGKLTRSMLYAKPPTELLGIQIKNQNPHMKKTYKGSPGAFGESDNVSLPPHALAQCQWEMLVTGASRWYFATYLGGKDLWIFNIWRDQAMLDRMIPKAEKFWRNHLDPDGPMDRPSDAKWNPKLGKTTVPRKLRGAELLNQPIPKGA